MDVEFYVPGDGDADAADEVLDTRKPRARRRWLIGWLAVGCAAAVVAGVLAAQGGGGPAPTRPIHVMPLRPPERVTFTPTPLILPDGAPAVFVDGTVVALAGDSLVWIDAAADTTAQARVDDPSADYTLVPDPAANRVWLVRTGRGSMQATAYDSRGSREQVSFGARAPATGAALLDGSLYVTSRTGVQRIAAGVSSGSLNSTGIRGADGITADPSRHRLLLVDAGMPGSIRILRPGAVSSARAAPAPFMKGELAVVAGQIWAAGYSRTGAVLARLDPVTLRPVRHSDLEPYLGPGGNLVATGPRTLFVRSGAGGEALWCVDADSGAVRRVWPDLAGSVVVIPDATPGARAGVYLATDSAPLHRLSGPGCLG